MKRHWHTIAPFIIILILGFTFNYKYLNEFPSHTHAWAQADRYALALGFVDNDLNLLKPQTYVLNHQFPDNWKVPSNSRITAVDFPIHDFIPAVFMKMTGSNAVWIFRLYILLYSFLGLFFLYKISVLLTNSIYKSVFVLLFAATAPVFVHYQASLLPSVPSLANAIIGLYFYFKHLIKNKEKDYQLSLLFLTLAALSRTTFAIPLIAVWGIEFFRWLTKNTTLKKKLLPSIVSGVTIVSYFIYNSFLTGKYGSIFLNHPVPAENFSQAIDILKKVYESWITEYFSLTHYIFLSAIIILFLIFREKTIVKFKSLFFWLFVALYFFGCFIFSILMLKQFYDHDYYFLDIFFLPSLFLLILIVTYLPKIKSIKVQGVITLFILLFFILTTVNAFQSQKTRHTSSYWDTVTATISGFTGSEDLLHAYGVGKESKILVIGSPAPNIPFILMNHKGYVMMSTRKENIIASMGWNWDFLVFQDDVFLSEIYTSYPEIISKIERIGGNGKISICKLKEGESAQSLSHFLGLDRRKPLYSDYISFDEPVSNDSWQNIRTTSQYFCSGEHAGEVTPDMDFGLTFKSSQISALQEKNCLLLFSSYFLIDNLLNDCQIVVSINEQGKSTFYKTYNLKYLIKNPYSWEKIDLLFQLPKVKSDDSEFAIYIWNKGKNQLYLDDFKLVIL